jgi:hypothetical protein
MGEFEVEVERIDDELSTVYHRHLFERAGAHTIRCRFVYPDDRPCSLMNVAVGTQLPSWEFRVLRVPQLDPPAHVEMHISQPEVRPRTITVDVAGEQDRMVRRY